MPSRHFVCHTTELPPGSRKLVQIGKKSVGVFNLQGEFYALLNLCPHQFAPLCLGNVTGYNAPSAVGVFNHEREGEIVRCPWHGWEFDIKTGRSIFNPHRVKTASYPVHLEAATAAGVTCPEQEPKDPSVETFPVQIEDQKIFVEV